MALTPRVVELRHFTECGLDDVWPENGFGEYGAAAAVRDEKQLWKSPGRGIAHQDRRMPGQELRFLRTLLDWTQTGPGHRLGYGDGQIVAKWEKARHKPVPGFADLFVQTAYREKIGERAMLTRISDRLPEITNVTAAPSRRVMVAKPMGQWRSKEAPAEM